MIKVTIGSSVYGLSFRRVHRPVKVNGKERDLIDTICNIKRICKDGRNCDEFICSGGAELSKNDKFNPITGKKIALQRALSGSSRFKTKTAKDERTLIWKAFNKSYKRWQ